MAIVGGILLLASAALLFVWSVQADRVRRAVVRLGARSDEEIARESPGPGGVSALAAKIEPSLGAGGGLRVRSVRANSLSRIRPRGYEIAGAALASAVLGLLFARLFFDWSGLVSAAIALDVGVLVGLVLATLRERQALRFEAQLAQLLRLSAASLRAGLGRIDSLAQATRQVGSPLAEVVGEAVGRLRLGEEPGSAFAALAQLVPLESFRLFSFVIAAQWHAGGSLQNTLGSIGESLQDRVEVGQRIQTQAAPTRSSVLTLAAASAAIAYFSHANDPENLGRFLRSDWGNQLVALTLALQGASLVWIWRLTRTRI